MAKKRVTIERQNGSTQVFDLEDSQKKDMRYHQRKYSDGLHFETLEAVENHFKRRFPNAENIDID